MEPNTEHDISPTIETGDVADTTQNSDTAATEEKSYTEYEKKLYNELQLAQRKIKKLEEGTKPTPAQSTASAELSQFDMFALVKANVEAEDIAEITDYAKLKGLSIADALKTPVVKTILSEKKQERETAAATSVKGTARGTSKLSDDSLLAMAKKGEMPESDADIARLIALRKANK